jgi:hypothetical protein
MKILNQLEEIIQWIDVNNERLDKLRSNVVGLDTATSSG